MAIKTKKTKGAIAISVDSFIMPLPNGVEGCVQKFHFLP